MEITKDMVEYVAELSRLKLTDEQCAATQKSLGDIIGYMDVLNNINTDGIEPMSHAFAVKNVMREDVVISGGEREELLANAPKANSEAFVVPRTVE